MKPSPQTLAASRKERAAADYDVLIVGAGPAGSTAAAFLARQGVSCLLLDRDKFPRDKVCGDGLTPQALYWLEQLGCADEVLGHTDCCITGCDLYINGRYIFSGKFSETTPYPPFCTLLPRKQFDHLLVHHAVARGATLQDGCTVSRITRRADAIVVEAEHEGGVQQFRGKILLGADGAGSRVSRFIGNSDPASTRAVSVRAYYQGVAASPAQMRIYFDERFFPGYGWMFVDDHGRANVGLGYLCDRMFPLRVNLKERFQEFVRTDLGDILKEATQLGQISGGWAGFNKLAARASERIMLVGDAGNCGDPLNGSGIHKAMESAALASRVALQALAENDFSSESMSRYERLLDAYGGLDWQSAELLLSFAKNPHLRLLCLQLLEHIARLTEHDPRFADFASGIFSGMTPQSWYLSPVTLLAAFPRQPEAWLALVAGNKFRNGLGAAAGLARGVASGLRQLVAHPAENFAWGLDIGAKAMNLGHALTRNQIASLRALPQRLGVPAGSPVPVRNGQFTTRNERRPAWPSAS